MVFDLHVKEQLKGRTKGRSKKKTLKPFVEKRPLITESVAWRSSAGRVL